MTPRKRLQTPVRWAIAGVVVVAMIFVGLLIMVLASMTSPSTTDPQSMELTEIGAVRVGVGMLILLTLPWYRKVPLLLMGSGTISALVLHLDPFVLAVGLTVWIARSQRRWHWVVGGAGLLVITVNAVLHVATLTRWPDADYARTGQILVVTLAALGIALVLGVSLWVRQRRSAQRAQASAHSAQQSSAELSDELTRRREREDLAREVHDTLAGRLSGLSLHVGSLEATAQRNDADHLGEALRTTRSYADQALTDLRILLSSLREGGSSPATPAKAPGGVADLQDLLDDAGSSGLQVHPYILLDGYAAAPEALQRAVLRITQEALTNALRYSSDGSVRARITGDEKRGITLDFRNRSGSEASFREGAGTGLIGIRERAELLGGTVDVSDEDGEFTVRVHLPVNAPETTQ